MAYQCLHCGCYWTVLQAKAGFVLHHNMPTLQLSRECLNALEGDDHYPQLCHVAALGLGMQTNLFIFIVLYMCTGPDMCTVLGACTVVLLSVI